MTMLDNKQFVDNLRAFTKDLDGCSRHGDVNIRGLLVFRYSLEKLINRENPDVFVKSLIHKNMPITKGRIGKVLCDREET